jgi:hypothetical protein
VRYCSLSSSSSSSERGGSEAESMSSVSWGRSQEGKGRWLEMVGDYVIVAREGRITLTCCYAWPG